VTPPAAAIQRFNGTGRARPRIISGLAADLSTIAIARATASDGQFPLTVAVLGGFEETQRAIHIFTNDLPPRSNMKGEVLRAYVEQTDAMVAAVAREFPDHLLVVLSPSGPVPPRLPTTALAVVRDMFASDDPGADDGFVLISGEGVAHHEKPSSAAPTDIVPTVLYAAGLPVGRDMDGRVLTDAFVEDVLRRNSLSLVQTYEAKELVVRRGGA
jgi:hypothetical protein